jgi:hypothetical protein
MTSSGRLYNWLVLCIIKNSFFNPPMLTVMVLKTMPEIDPIFICIATSTETVVFWFSNDHFWDRNSSRLQPLHSIVCLIISCETYAHHEQIILNSNLKNNRALSFKIIKTNFKKRGEL